MRIRTIAVALTIALMPTAAIVAGNRLAQTGSNAVAEALLKAARTALGGEARIAAIKSIVIKGDGTLANQMYGRAEAAKAQSWAAPVEYRILFPDNYLHATLMAGRWPFRTGFSGTEMISEIDLPGGAKVERGKGDSIDKARADLARFALVMLLRTDTAMPLVLRSSSGSTLEFSGLGPLPCFVDLDGETHLPIRLRMQFRMQSASSPTEDISLNVDSWKEVSGLKLPHHLWYVTAGRTNMDERFKSIEVDAPLKVADFRKK